MRPIDADALVQVLESVVSDYDSHGDVLKSKAVQCAIKFLTTEEISPALDYEPVKHGTWEWYEEPYDSWNPDGDYGWRCSCCKQDLAAELTLGIPGMHYAYDVLDDPDNPPNIKRCLFCGAKMKEG